MNETEFLLPGEELLPAEDAPTAIETLEIPPPEQRPLMTTNFADYTVTEGLLLLIFLALVLELLCKLIREVL